RTAEGSRRLAGLDVVDRDGAPERHVEVRMRVDAAREDVLAARVDHLVRRDVERLADQRDGLVLGADVRDVVVRRGDAPASLDQDRHRGEFMLALMPLSPSRVVAELKELRELTGNENGAQRVAWTNTWEQARAWLREKLDGLPLEHELDEAGNQWWTL